MIHTVIHNITRLFKKRSRKTSRNHFYFNKIYFKRIDTLYEVFAQKKASGNIFVTSEPIQPLGLKFSAPYKEVLKNLGKPSYIYSNNDAQNHHQALFVRQTVSNLNLIVQLQFHNDKLFFIALEVSKKSDSNLDKTDIINTVILKYLKKPHHANEEYPVIEDEMGNFIMINDEVNFSICYLDGKFHNVKNLRRVKEVATSTEKDQKAKEGLFYAF